MFKWFSDNSEVTIATLTEKYDIANFIFKTEYYAQGSFPYGSMKSFFTPRMVDQSYYYKTNLDLKWGYRGLTRPNRVALCLDNGVQGQADQSPSNPNPIYNWHNANGTIWTLVGYPNKNYNEVEKTVLGTFPTNTTYFTPGRGTFKWNTLSYSAGVYFTHYWWYPSRFDGPVTFWSCPPVLGH